MRKKDDKMYQIILDEIKNNNMVTEVFIANKYGVSERTIRRYIKDLKGNNEIFLVSAGKNRQWDIRRK